MSLRVAALLAVVSFSVSADAIQYMGNPELGIVATRGLNDITSASAYVNSVRVHKCAGGYEEYAVNANVDFAAGWTKTIAPGDYCGVSVRYGTALSVTNGSWTVSYSEPHTSFTLDGGEAVYQALTPFTSTQGTFSGGAPGLELTIY